MICRDYLSVKVWDLHIETKTIETYTIHEYLRSKLCSLYENNCIFDFFPKRALIRAMSAVKNMNIPQQIKEIELPELKYVHLLNFLLVNVFLLSSKINLRNKMIFPCFTITNLYSPFWFLKILVVFSTFHIKHSWTRLRTRVSDSSRNTWSSNIE